MAPVLAPYSPSPLVSSALPPTPAALDSASCEGPLGAWWAPLARGHGDTLTQGVPKGRPEAARLPRHRRAPPRLQGPQRRSKLPLLRGLCHKHLGRVRLCTRTRLCCVCVFKWTEQYLIPVCVVFASLYMYAHCTLLLHYLKINNYSWGTASSTPVLSRAPIMASLSHWYLKSSVY